MGTLSLLVAGGNEMARKGLCALVREQAGWNLAAEARNGREAVEKSKEFKPDVAIMDIDMPSLNGLEATRQITKVSHELRSCFWLHMTPIKYSRKQWRREPAGIC
jgi:YesN/AraC family two-component response regulator